MSIENDYREVFNPRTYLNAYFNDPSDEEIKFGIRFLVAALRDNDLPSQLQALEFGGGPTLIAVAALASRATEIHFCDYTPANLDEVRCWLNDEPDIFDWSSCIKVTLEEEGLSATPEAVAHRMAEMRRKVTHLTTCDALKSAPLGENAGQYDFVVARDCTDVAASTVSEWIQVMCNVSTLVKPGGWLLINVTTGTTINTVEQKVFSCVSLTDEDIYHGYKVAGYDLDTFRLDKITVPVGREYTGSTGAVARKLNTSQ
jgi:nicotinamide N-methyltransferase/methyltransferase